MVAAVAGAVALVTCTTAPGPTPSPSPPVTTTPPVQQDVAQLGLRAAVVLPAPGGYAAGEIDALADDLDQLAEDLTADITQLRVVTANDSRFLPDMVALLAGEGYDLVCAVGPTAGAIVLDAAPTFPATRFCATPASADDVPANVLLVDVRVEEAAYLAGAGAAAAAASGETAPGVVIAAEGYAVDLWAQAFRNGVQAQAAAASPRVLEVAGVDQAVAAAADLVAAGVATVVTAAGAADPVVRNVAAAAGAAVVGSSDALDGEGDEPSPDVLLFVDQDLTVALELALTRLVDGFEPGLASVGLAEAAIGFARGGSPRATVAGDAATRAAGAIVGGSVVPAAPLTRPSPAAPSPGPPTTGAS